MKIERDKIIDVIDYWTKKHMPSLYDTRSYSTMRNNIKDLKQMIKDIK